MLLGEAIAAGARGVEPARSGARTRNLGSTRDHPRAVGPRHADGRDPCGAAHRARDQQDERATAGQAAGAAPAGLPPADVRLRPRRARIARRPSAPGGSRAARRFFALLAVVVLFVAAVAVAITIAASTSNNVVHFRKVVAHDTSDAVQQVQKHHQQVHEVAGPVRVALV